VGGDGRRFDPAVRSVREIDDVCGRASSALIPSRWLQAACDDARFRFVAAPESLSGVLTTFVTPPQSEVPAELVPLDSSLPDGFVAYRVDTERRRPPAGVRRARRRDRSDVGAAGGAAVGSDRRPRRRPRPGRRHR
jgi:hypothetical protein